MESDYDTKAWSRETELGRRIFNYNFRMFGREITGWELLKAVPMHRVSTLSEMTYIWQNKSAPKQQLVRVNVGELPDWRSAQKHLHGESHAIWTQGGDLFPRVTSQDTVIGADGKIYVSDQATIW